MKIKVRDFYFKDDSNKFKVTGFIAQELFQAYPNAVRKPNNSSDIWMVSKEELIPLIVKSIQDQQNEIDTLKSHLQNQQQTIQDLLKRVAVLEAKK